MAKQLTLKKVHPKINKQKAIDRGAKKESQEFEETLRLHKNLKSSSYDSSLKRIRQQLPKKNQKALSGIIHAKGMDSVNDLLINTFARPKSILGGSLLALIGVSIGAYLAKYYGYSYNYLLLFLLFILGYVIEFLVESVINFFVRFK